MNVWMFVAIVSATATDTHAQSLFTLTSGNSRFEIDTSNRATGYEWHVDGKQHLEELSNWYRVGNNPTTPETSVHLLPIQSEVQNAPNSVTVQYLNRGVFQLDIEYAVIGGAIGSGFSSFGETITITNLMPTPLFLDLFEYVDLDLDETPLDDTVELVTANQIYQHDVFTDFFAFYDADRHELNYEPATLNKLTDFSASNLNDVWPAGAGPVGPPGDVTWAVQWDFGGPQSLRPAIPAFDTVVITKETELQMYFIPEPRGGCLAAVTLIALWTLRPRII